MPHVLLDGVEGNAEVGGDRTESVAHLLRLMKGAYDTYNVRGYNYFFDIRHSQDVGVQSIGAPFDGRWQVAWRGNRELHEVLPGRACAQ